MSNDGLIIKKFQRKISKGQRIAGFPFDPLPHRFEKYDSWARPTAQRFGLNARLLLAIRC
jgi:hypothetical protein